MQTARVTTFFMSDCGYKLHIIMVTFMYQFLETDGSKIVRVTAFLLDSPSNSMQIIMVTPLKRFRFSVRNKTARVTITMRFL